MRPERDYSDELWRLILFKAGLAAGAARLATWAPQWWLSAAFLAAAAVLLVLVLVDCRTYGRMCRLDNEQRIRHRQRAVPARLGHRSRRRVRRPP